MKTNPNRTRRPLPQAAYSTPKRTAQKPYVQRDLHQEVTDKLVALLEKGVAPWTKPWRVLADNSGRSGAPVETPRNYVSGKSYRGINVWMLADLPYQRPYYLTFKQAQQLGGIIRKGERGQMIVFYKLVEVEEGENVGKKIPYLKHDTVFNIEQTEGIDFTLPDLKPYVADPALILQACEDIVTGYQNRPTIVYLDPDRACYSTAADRVNMPRIEAFKTPENYYKTLFHELGHSTGHPNRLNRVFSKAKFDDDYNREELIAEITASFLAASAGIFQSALVADSARYLDYFIKALKGDKRLIFKASSAAQRAMDWILIGLTQTQQPNTDSDGSELN